MYCLEMTLTVARRERLQDEKRMRGSWFLLSRFQGCKAFHAEGQRRGQSLALPKLVLRGSFDKSTLQGQAGEFKQVTLAAL